MNWIALEGVEIYAKHGIYEEERKIERKFIVDVKLGIPFAENPNDKIGQTVNYEELYELTVKKVSQHGFLLESVAWETAEAILSAFPIVAEIGIVIRKLNPPVSGDCSSFTVTINQKRNT